MTNVGHWGSPREGCGWRVRTGEPGDLVQPAHDNTPSAKRGPSVRTSLRFTLAAACAAGLVAAPVATALDTTIRVEGSSATLIPESAIPIEGSGAATVFDKNSAAVDVSRASAFWQLYRATQSTGLGFGFEYFPAFSSSLIQKIGPDENVGSTGWQFRVNHVAPPVGADAATLAQGSTVLWYYGGFDAVRELDVRPSSDKVTKGTSFTVTVTSYSDTGEAQPGAGATVRYGQVAATADGAGSATFIAQGNGTQPVTASRAGDIRSAGRNVCSYDGDPTVCNLPATAATPAPIVSANTDTIAPGSRIVFPAIGRRYTRVSAIRGRTGADRSDVKGVRVALAMRVGTQCRFRTRTGSLTRPRSCARQLFLPAASAGGNWSLRLRKKALGPGIWRVWSRATDGAGNTESVALARVNGGQFRVVRKRLKR